MTGRLIGKREDFLAYFHLCTDVNKFSHELGKSRLLSTNLGILCDFGFLRVEVSLCLQINNALR